MSDKKDYLVALRAVQQIPFGVGRNLLIDFLNGSEENESVKKNNLKELPDFGGLAYGRGELNSLLGSLLVKGMLEITSLPSNRFCKVLKLTSRGEEELRRPLAGGEAEGAASGSSMPSGSQESSVLSSSSTIHSKAQITEDDRKLFAEFDFFLSSYNDEQKKAILSNNNSVLCVAGAGSGKTTVLTKRVEFLVKFRSVPAARILAITFTRKARQEMMKRLAKEGLADAVMVETFNSFCEKILKKHNELAYDKPVRVISYADKVRMVKSALSKLGLGMEQALQKYFNSGQQKGKTPEQLMNIFMNDCFFIRDYFKFKNRPLKEFSCDAGNKCFESAMLVRSVCMHIQELMDQHGLRDYADQLLDTLKLFREHPELVPEFEHVMIDEYQDVNSTQIELINMLKPKNLFCVGDPRQSIYGWRGSDINYILCFEEDHPGCEVVHLTMNYRSTNHIVELINRGIRNMNLPDLEAVKYGDKELMVLDFASEEAEYEFVIQRILSSSSSSLPRNEIFVLARTNRQLNELSMLMKARAIKHVIKSEDSDHNIMLMEDELTLATVHAIKGLEAEMVFVIGCTTANFPCRGSEHPVIDVVKMDEYDKDEEERRLFYVALSRAKSALYLSYSSKSPTSYLTRSMIRLIDPDNEALHQKQLSEWEGENRPSFKGDSQGVLERLHEWRTRTSEALGVPPFMIMHDKTLYEIAEKMPLNTEELTDIYGMGHAKIRRYGEEILGLIMC